MGAKIIGNILKIASIVVLLSAILGISHFDEDKTFVLFLLTGFLLTFLGTLIHAIGLSAELYTKDAINTEIRSSLIGIGCVVFLMVMTFLFI